MAETPTPQEATLLKDIKNTLTVLQDIRRPYEAMIDDILTYIYHGRRKVKDAPASRGAKTGIQVYDGTALGAVNLLTDGLTGYTVSKAFKWFGYTLPHKINFLRTSNQRSQRLDSLPDVKRWLEDCEEAMYAAFLASNLYDIAPEIVRDVATVGTVTVNADEDIRNGRVVFTVPHFRECFCAENAFGMIDTNYRVYSLTLKQLVEKFGYDQMVAADRSFAKKYEKNRHSEAEVIHARFPRADYDPNKITGRNKPHASVWVLRSPERLLLESGTGQQQFVTWRWRKNSDEWYGRSPAWDAFVDAMTANQAAKTNLTAAQKMVDPPMIGPSDMRGMVQRGPGGWTSIDSMGRDPRPLIENIQLPFGLEVQDRLDAKIRDHFHVDFFLMLTQAAMQKVEMTATQVIEMGGEKAAVLGPRIGRMETECLNPIHDMLFEIERRAGRIPPPPDVLLEYSGAEMQVAYMGPLAQAQKKLFNTQGITQGLNAIAGIAQVFPQIRDLINPDETGRELLTSYGFPQKALYDDETVKAIRQTRQQAEAQQAGMEQTIQMAKAMPAAGKKIDDESAMGRLMEKNGQTD